MLTTDEGVPAWRHSRRGEQRPRRGPAQALAHVSAEDMVDHYRKCGYAPLPLRDDVVAQLKIARSVAVWGALSLCALTINFE
jgi:hypothetical protein